MIQTGIWIIYYAWLSIKNTDLNAFQNFYIINLLGTMLNAPRVQQPAPPFKGMAAFGDDFKEISLIDFKGQYVVLFFYPLDL